MQSRLEMFGVILGSLVLTSSAALADDGRKIELRPERVALTQASEPVTVVVPPGGSAETYQTWDTNLFIGGAVLFGASYGGAVVAASQSDDQDHDRLYVPVLGPWLDLADRGDCDIELSACDDETTTKVLLVGDGILQAGGAAMMISSVLFPKTVTQSKPAYALRHVKPIRVGQDNGRGLAFNGTF